MPGDGPGFGARNRAGNNAADSRPMALPPSNEVRPARAAQQPSVKSLGITSQLTGSRADIIVADDIEVPNNTQTHSMDLFLISNLNAQRYQKHGNYTLEI